ICGIFVSFNRGSRLFRRLYFNIEAMPFAFAVDISSQEHSRAKPAVFFRGVTERHAILDVVTNISRRSNAGSEISWAKLSVVKMRMHVPKSRQQIFAADIDHFGILWNLDCRARTNSGYAITIDYNCGIRSSRLSGDVDQCGAN